MTTATLCYETYQLPKTSYSIRDTNLADTVSNIVTLKLSLFQVLIMSVLSTIGYFLNHKPPITVYHLFHIPLTIDCYNIQIKYYVWELLLSLTSLVLLGEYT